MAQSDAARSRAGGRPRDPALDEAIILATRARLVQDGYSRMTVGDIAADAGVSRPTLYRRWSTKFELVADALDYGFRKQRDMLRRRPDRTRAARGAPRGRPPAGSRVLQPGRHGAHGQLRRRGDPHPGTTRDPARRTQLSHASRSSRTCCRSSRSAARSRDGIDKHTIAIMCFGSYFAAFYRGNSKRKIPEAVVAVLWPAIATRARTRRPTRHAH